MNPFSRVLLLLPEKRTPWVQITVVTNLFLPPFVKSPLVFWPADAEFHSPRAWESSKKNRSSEGLRGGVVVEIISEAYFY